MSTVELNTHIPHSARIYDYMLGGKDNFEADRQAAERVLQVFPEGRDLAWANRRFMRRTVTYCAAHVGQIVDVGTGIPTPPNTADVARAVNPEATVVGVDNDPVVLVHDRALLGGVRIVDGDVREPERLIASLDGVIDWERPVALVFIALLHFVEDPHRVVGAFRDALAPGSLLVISHVTGDGVSDATVDRVDEVYGSAPVPLRLRPEKEIRALFDGTTLAEPGLVDVQRWRPDADAESPIDLRILGGVGHLG